MYGAICETAVYANYLSTTQVEQAENHMGITWGMRQLIAPPPPPAPTVTCSTLVQGSSFQGNLQLSYPTFSSGWHTPSTLTVKMCYCESNKLSYVSDPARRPYECARLGSCWDVPFGSSKLVFNMKAGSSNNFQFVLLAQTGDLSQENQWTHFRHPPWQYCQSRVTEHYCFVAGPLSEPTTCT